MTVLRLSGEWWSREGSGPPAESNFAAVLDEIELELSPDHELAGKIVRVEARYWPSDDVVVSLVDGTFALVHPTWDEPRRANPVPGVDPSRRRGSRRLAACSNSRGGNAHHSLAAASEAIEKWEEWR